MVKITQEDIMLAALLARPIDELELTTRAYNGLKRTGTYTIAEMLVKLKTGDIHKLRNIGEKTVYDIQNEIRRYLEKYGYEVEGKA